MIAPKGYDVDATIEYTCDEGHLLVGPSKRSCMETGFYNEFPPVCKCKFHFLFRINIKLFYLNFMIDTINSLTKS